MTEETREQLVSDIMARSEVVSEDSGRETRVLFEAQAAELAGTNNCHLRWVFELALSKGVLPFRYVRNQQAIAADDQLRLCRSRVVVVGVGGLGGYAAEQLARLGIGALVLVDPDVFVESNLNRQRFARASSLGRPKAEAAAEEIFAINPGVEVSGRQERLNRENGAELIAGADVVVDGLDNIADRLLLQKLCEEKGIPMVHGAIAGFEGQVSTVLPGAAGLKTLYGESPAESPPPEAVLGVPSLTPMMIAGLQVMEVLKILLNRKRLLSGRMLYLDLKAPAIETFSFEDA